MTNALYIAIGSFQVALAQFWKDYADRPKLAGLYDMYRADKILQQHRDVLVQVRNMQRHACNITRCLNTDALKALKKKEN